MSKPTQQRNKGRARVMYGTPPKGADSLKLYDFPIITRPDEKPVFVLPATPEAVEEMRERVAKAMHDNNSVPGYRPPWEVKSKGMKKRYYVMADAALSELGFSPRGHKGRTFAD